MTLHRALDIPSVSIDNTYHTGRTTCGSHQSRLNRVIASDKHSPLWKVTVPRTIPEWNKLSSEIVRDDWLLLRVGYLPTLRQILRTIQPSGFCLIRGGQPSLEAGSPADYTYRSRSSTLGTHGNLARCPSCTLGIWIWIWMIICSPQRLSINADGGWRVAGD